MGVSGLRDMRDSEVQLHIFHANLLLLAPVAHWHALAFMLLSDKAVVHADCTPAWAAQLAHLCLLSFSFLWQRGSHKSLPICVPYLPSLFCGAQEAIRSSRQQAEASAMARLRAQQGGPLLQHCATAEKHSIVCATAEKLPIVCATARKHPIVCASAEKLPIICTTAEKHPIICATAQKHPQTPACRTV